MKRRVTLPPSKADKYRQIEVNDFLIKITEDIPEIHCIVKMQPGDPGMCVMCPVERFGQLLVDYTQPYVTTTEKELEE